MNWHKILTVFHLESGQVIRNCFLICTYLLAIFPVCSYTMRSAIIACWALAGIAYTIHTKPYKNGSFHLVDKRILGGIMLLFLILAISVLYSQNKEEGIKQIGKMVSILILPSVFFINRLLFKSSIVHTLLYCFCASVVVFVLYQLVLLGMYPEVFSSDLTSQELKNNVIKDLTNVPNDVLQRIRLRRLRGFLMDSVDSHPIYQGLWCSFVLFFCYNNLRKGIRSRIVKIGFILIMMLMFFWMIMISSRMPLIATGVAAFAVMVLHRHFSLKKIGLSAIVVVLGCTIVFASVEPVQTRFKEIYEKMFSFPSKGDNIQNYNSTSVRAGIYYCDAQIAKENWLFGVGVGDIQAHLSNCYNEKLEAKVYTWKTYNSHNQYFFFLLSAGILGLIIFIFLLFSLFKKSFLQKDSIYLYFVILISLVLLTENVISRSDGISFFSLFVALLLITSSNEKEKTKINIA